MLWAGSLNAGSPGEVKTEANNTDCERLSTNRGSVYSQVKALRVGRPRT